MIRIWGPTLHAGSKSRKAHLIGLPILRGIVGRDRSDLRLATRVVDGLPARHRLERAGVRDLHLAILGHVSQHTDCIVGVGPGDGGADDALAVTWHTA